MFSLSRRTLTQISQTRPQSQIGLGPRKEGTKVQQFLTLPERTSAPTRKKPRRDSDAPRLTKSNTANGLPKRVSPDTASADPIRMKPRNEVADPKCTKSSTVSEFPKRDMPYIDDELPIHAKLRRTVMLQCAQSPALTTCIPSETCHRLRMVLPCV